MRLEKKPQASGIRKFDLESSGCNVQSAERGCSLEFASQALEVEPFESKTTSSASRALVDVHFDEFKCEVRVMAASFSVHNHCEGVAGTVVRRGALRQPEAKYTLLWSFVRVEASREATRRMRKGSTLRPLHVKPLFLRRPCAFRIT